MPVVEEVIELGARITTMRAEVARLQDLQRELKSAERKLAEYIGVSVDEADSSIHERVFEYLEENPTLSCEAEEIQSRIGVANLNSVRGSLARLLKEGRIRRPERGRYCALGSVQVIGEMSKAS